VTFDLKSYLENRRAMVEAALERVLPPEAAPPTRIHQAMRYSVLAPGKRLRPILVVAGAEAVGGRAETVLDTACALELIHAYSLIHDDLPAMDDDDYRRGRLTNHKVFGEALAILAGDALLTLAFRLVANNAARIAPGVVGLVVAEVADAAGTDGMVGGQVRGQDDLGRDAGLHPPAQDGRAHSRGAARGRRAGRRTRRSGGRDQPGRRGARARVSDRG